MVYCISFKDTSASNLSEVGVKALNLAMLHNEGYPVPHGFIIKSRALNDFILKNKLAAFVNPIVDNVNVDNYAALVDASRKITEQIMKCSLPEDMAREITAIYKNFNVSDDMKGLNEQAKNMITAGRGDVAVALRCSPVIENHKRKASGIHRPVLNITGAPSLVKSVVKCFASLYSPEAIYYYKKNNVRAHELALVVQDMVISEKAGNLATANPVTSNLNEFVIESSFGLGQSISEGDVVPDRYVLNVRESAITSAKINRKSSQVVTDKLNGGTKKERIGAEDTGSSSLSTSEIKVIAELGDKIQVHFNHPQDIEWAISKRRVYILEATPMNTIKTQVAGMSGPSGMNGDGISGSDMNGMNGNSKTALIEGTAAVPKQANGKPGIISSPYEIQNLPEGTVLVAAKASLDLIPAFSKVKGIVTSSGGVLSNFAKIAREMEIPLIVGAADATMKLSSVEFISLDSNSGKITAAEPAIAEPVSTATTPAFKAGDRAPGMMASGLSGTSEPEKEEDLIIATKFKVYALEGQEYTDMKDVSDGIGYFLLNGSAANEMNSAADYENGNNGGSNGFQNGYQTQSPMQYGGGGPAFLQANTELDKVQKLADMFYPKSIWVRTKELSSPQFKKDLEGMRMIIEKGYTNVGIMFPAGHHKSYVEKMKEMATQCGLNVANIEFGICAETPASCMLSDDYSSCGIKFVSIDLDRVVRNTLGLGPDTKITNHYMHPAVLKMLRHAIRSYKKHKIVAAVHCRSPASQEFIEKLVEFHADSITVGKENLKLFKYVAARKERKMLLDIMMQKRFNQDL